MIRLGIGFAVGFIAAYLSPLWITGGPWMNASVILRLVACICFVLAVFGVAPGGLAPVPLGLAFWVGSTFA